MPTVVLLADNAGLWLAVRFSAEELDPSCYLSQCSHSASFLALEQRDGV